MSIFDKTLERLEQKRRGLFHRVQFDCAAFHEQPRARKHLVFIDGTGNDPSADGKRTNVHRLSEWIVNDSITQYVSYHEGIGSGADEPNPVSALFRKTGGKGADRIMNQAYLQLVKDYWPGDKLFLFGFSRGAAIARMLANKIAKEGIPEKGWECSHEYKVNGKILLDHLELEGERRKIDRIEVLGLWDTVVSLGIFERLFEPAPMLGIPSIVGKVYHYVSIDENRIPFRPTLVERDQGVEEIWFPGVHSDVGGGYTKRGLADISLHFMTNRLLDHDVRFLEPEKADKRPQTLQKDPTDPDNPDPYGTIHRHGWKWGPKLSRKIHFVGAGKPRIHKSARERMKCKDVVPVYRPRWLEHLINSEQYEPEDRD